MLQFRQTRSQAFGGTSKRICLAWPLRGDCLIYSFIREQSGFYSI
jgi:hypothetical protein